MIVHGCALPVLAQAQLEELPGSLLAQVDRAQAPVLCCVEVGHAPPLNLFPRGTPVNRHVDTERIAVQRLVGHVQVAHDYGERKLDRSHLRGVERTRDEAHRVRQAAAGVGQQGVARYAGILQGVPVEVGIVARLRHNLPVIGKERARLEAFEERQAVAVGDSDRQRIRPRGEQLAAPIALVDCLDHV